MHPLAEPTLAQSLAARLQDVRIDNASAGALSMAHLAITDTVGAMLAGATEPCATLLRDTVCETGPQREATLVGMAQRANVLDAALINGTAAHAIDIDDMSGSLYGHPSAPVLPVVLALGERLGSSGRDVVDAYIAGVEAECRLGRVVNPHHYEHGWHPTSTMGVFGACAAAARLLKMDVAQTAVAFGLCGSLAGGVKANFGTMTKPLHVGHCARDGLMTALLVSRGYTASPGALEHRQGFLAVFDGPANVQPQQMLDSWGSQLEIEDPMFGLKQFACCGSTHNAIMSMLAIRHCHPLRADEVEAIEITAQRRRLPHTHNPFPQTALQSKFSIQYATVRALLDGAPRMAHFEGSAFMEPVVTQLLQRTSTRARPPETEDSAGEWGAEVTVTLRNGGKLHGKSEVMGRGPSDPMNQEEMWQKFSDCASNVLAPPQAERAFAALGRMAAAERIADVTGLLASERP